MIYGIIYEQKHMVFDMTWYAIFYILYYVSYKAFDMIYTI